jgi:hypothetical protein
MRRWLLSTVNRALRLAGLALVPVPSSAKMLFEHANVCESHRNVHGHGDRCLYWLRSVGEVVR